MLWNIQKFNREINALKRLGNEDALHPLRKEQLKMNVISSLGDLSPFPAIASASPAGRLIKYLISILLGLGLVGGTAAAASQNSLPGSALYPIKRAVEKLETGLAISTGAKARVETKHAEKRLQELTELELKSEADVVIVENDNNSSGASDGQNLQASSSVGVGASSTAAQNPTHPPAKDKNTRRNKVRLQARQDAQDQLGRAKESLERVKAKLEAKGNSQGAKEIERTIENLEAQALNAGLKAEVKGESTKSQDEPDKSGRVKVKLPIIPKNNLLELRNYSSTRIEID